MKTRANAIVLAAGYSSRMGEFKPLLPLGETTVLERIITLFQDAGVSELLRAVPGTHQGKAISRPFDMETSLTAPGSARNTWK